jgi:hypothetical protein
VSYTWSRNRGNVGNQDSVNAGLNDLGSLPTPAGIGVFMSPNAQINADGRAIFDVSELKAPGTYELAALGALVVGAAFRYETGVRWDRSLNLAPLQFVTIPAKSVRIPTGARCCLAAEVARKEQIAFVPDLWTRGSSFRLSFLSFLSFLPFLSYIDINLSI